MLKKLSAEDISRMWRQTYNYGDKPDWSHLFPYYHDEIVFEDIIQKIEGKEDFIAMCKRLSDRSGNIRMETVSVVVMDNAAFIEWEMKIQFKKYPATPMYGCTKLTFGEDNRIIHQRDYFDLWGDIFNGIPRFNKMYRKFVKRHFG
jgi:limonene-1,2-epoxide hydrolase